MGNAPRWFFFYWRRPNPRASRLVTDTARHRQSKGERKCQIGIGERVAAAATPCTKISDGYRATQAVEEGGEWVAAACSFDLAAPRPPRTKISAGYRAGTESGKADRKSFSVAATKTTRQLLHAKYDATKAVDGID